MLFRDAVVFAQIAFGLVPEILYAVDVILAFGKDVAVIDAAVMEQRDIENIVAGVAIGIDDGIRQDALLHGIQEGIGCRVGDHLRVDFPAALQDAEHRNFSCRAPATLAFADAAEITFINLECALLRKNIRQLSGNDFAQLLIKQRRGMPIYLG